MTTIPDTAAATAVATVPADAGRRVRRIAAGRSIIGARVLTLSGYLTCPWAARPRPSTSAR